MHPSPIKLPLALLFCGLIGCAAEAASQGPAGNPSAVAHTGAVSNSSAQATLVSPSGKAVVNGDTVEIRGGELSVNGISYGAVHPGVHVRYVKENGIARVFVGDEERHPKSAK